MGRVGLVARGRRAAAWQLERQVRCIGEAAINSGFATVAAALRLTPGTV